MTADLLPYLNTALLLSILTLKIVFYVRMSRRQEDAVREAKLSRATSHLAERKADDARETLGGIKAAVDKVLPTPEAWHPGDPERRKDGGSGVGLGGK